MSLFFLLAIHLKLCSAYVNIFWECSQIQLYLSDKLNKENPAFSSFENIKNYLDGDCQTLVNFQYEGNKNPKNSSELCSFYKNVFERKVTESKIGNPTVDDLRLFNTEICNELTNEPRQIDQIIAYVCTGIVGVCFVLVISYSIVQLYKNKTRSKFEKSK
ncbi:uncharacterized protein MONOS_17095 [Monocercomonoides exilis]|uniref:uncharacterized protein n=1 Tax=Monocercomonoides exilis TaxID=2049356 RepID=UPI00355A0F91|nr:hypothetical protein MONOS_17095 [Monocercomonoides exilis]